MTIWFSIICNVIKEEDKLLDDELSLIIGMTIKPLPFNETVPDVKLSLSAEQVKQIVVVMGVAAILVVFSIAGFSITSLGGIISGLFVW